MLGKRKKNPIVAEPPPAGPFALLKIDPHPPHPTPSPPCLRSMLDLKSAFPNSIHHLSKQLWETMTSYPYPRPLHHHRLFLLFRRRRGRTLRRTPPPFSAAAATSSGLSPSFWCSHSGPCSPAPSPSAGPPEISTTASAKTITPPPPMISTFS